MHLLDVADHVDQMDIRGLALHPLKGKRKGTWAVTVRANYRITWSVDIDGAFIDGAFIDIDYEDYH